MSWKFTPCNLMIKNLLNPWNFTSDTLYKYSVTFSFWLIHYAGGPAIVWSQCYGTAEWTNLNQVFFFWLQTIIQHRSFCITHY
jgi:hypothetical protein